LYDSDSYSDDLPYWTELHGHPHLIIPYTLSENDMKFVSPNGFVTGSDFELYLRNHLDYLLKEARQGDVGDGYLMSVGLHCRVIGRPGRCSGLEKFIDYALSLQDEVWICRREEIAKHWYQNHWDDQWGEKSAEVLNAVKGIR
jgi:allantoinase